MHLCIGERALGHVCKDVIFLLSPSLGDGKHVQFEGMARFPDLLQAYQLRLCNERKFSCLGYVV